MAAEVEVIWKEAFLTYTRYCPSIYMEELRKTTKT
jgi:hypothetical protein